MLFINTRPKERAKPLSQAISKLGYDVVELPLLTLTALPLDQTLQRQFIQFKHSDIVIVVSPIAAEIGLNYAKQSHYTLDEIKHKKWISVGKTTQSYLQKMGIDSVCPAIENSEGMLELPIFQQQTTQQPLTATFWRGIGGRTLMIEQLKNKKIDIINMLLYTREMPIYTTYPLEKYLSNIQTIVVLISSEASWKNWKKLNRQFYPEENLQQYGRLNCHYLVLGQRIAHILSQDLNALKIKAEIYVVDRLDIVSIQQQLNQISHQECR